jgi:peptidoglycan L-alanyl-D-glutamate endopeptidase CwlK
MAYQLSQRSERELDGVHPALVAVVHRAIEITAQDFGVHDGIRVIEDQRALVESGASQTMDSKHLVQQGTGYGHAVDLVPYVRGSLRWEWLPIHAVCLAVKQAADELGVEIRWGGCWAALADVEDPEEAVAAYLAKRRGEGKRAFADGPHYELAAVPAKVATITEEPILAPTIHEEARRMKALQGKKTYLVLAAAGILWALGAVDIVPESMVEQGLAGLAVLGGGTIAAKINRLKA